MKGLTTKEAKRRLKKFGKNKIQRKEKISAWKIFLSQFTSPLILILIVAAILLGILGFFSEERNIVDIVLILIIVFASGISGFFQDYKAEKSIEALQKMAQPKSKVIRDGREIIINSSEIVPGDLIIISEGDIVPADAEIIESNNLKINESTLTGESKSVLKKNKDWIYMNTSVIVGNGKAIVKKTGMSTRLGKIAYKLETIKEEKTPFYKEVDNLSKKLFWIILVIVIITSLASLVKYGWYESILSGIALAVAAIPEGLPAVIILSLAIGAKVMAKKKALIRKLGVAESLGAISVICVDKTGTLTKNEMDVVKVFFNNREYSVENLRKEKIRELLLCCVLNNNVREIYSEEKKLLGDQTEVALYNFGKKFGFNKKELDEKYKRIYEISFSSERKMMSVVVEKEKKNTLYSKGAPEVLIKKCNRILEGGKVRTLTKKDKEDILNMNNKFAYNALRVLGFAYKNIKKGSSKNNLEENLIWLGLVGIIDPPRKGVGAAVGECKRAGIRVIMLTGDNPLTAKAIALETDIQTSEILTGEDLEKISDGGLIKKLDEGVNVFARLTPDQKLRIMSVLKQKENVVAMTGDGVNDALALKKADVGIAMGIRGTEVAKQASDLVLLDDNFVTIVSGIKEGRRIFDNTRKFVSYLLTCNIAEVAVIFFATLFVSLKYPILLPVHLLWINLLTDGLPALALGVDPANPNIMKKPPRKKSEHIINKKLIYTIGIIGLKKTGMLFAIFFLTLHFFDFLIARTTLFTGFVLFEFVRIGSIRATEKLKWTDNKLLLYSLGFSLLLQMIIIYTPLNKLFKVTPLGIYPWIILLVGAVIAFILAIFIAKIIDEYVK